MRNIIKKWYISLVFTQMLLSFTKNETVFLKMILSRKKLIKQLFNMFDTPKNRTRDMQRRMRQMESKGSGPSPVQRRRIKKYRLKKSRNAVKKSIGFETPTKSASKRQRVPGAPKKKRRMSRRIAAIRLQMAWRRYAVSTRCFKRQIHTDIFEDNDDDIFSMAIALNSCKSRLENLTDKLNDILQFVNNPYSVLVDCSPLRSQIRFFTNQATCVGNIFGEVLLNEDMMNIGLLHKCMLIHNSQFNIITIIKDITVRMNALDAMRPNIPNAN